MSNNLLPRPSYGRFLAHQILGWAVVVVAITFHLLVVSSAQEWKLEDAEQQARLRAAQTSHALALQTASEFQKIDFVVQHLIEHWLRDDLADFDHAVGLAHQFVRPDLLARIKILDTEGRVVYSDQTASGVVPLRTDYSDMSVREVTSAENADRLILGQPTQDAVTDLAVVPFSRAIHAQGRFQGVLTLTVSSRALSSTLNQILPRSEDVAVLAREDGPYLARSSLFEKVKGTSVPKEADFLVHPARIKGQHDLHAPVDDTTRMYAWHRVPGYPAVVSVGFNKESLLGPVTATLNSNMKQNLIGITILLLAALWISWQSLVRFRQSTALVDVHEELDLAVRGTGRGIWNWLPDQDRIDVSEQACAILGYRRPGSYLPFSTVLEFIHPDDRDAVRSEMNAHLKGATEFFEADYRMRHKNGEWVWVHNRGQAVEMNSDGTPRRMSGMVQDVSEQVREAGLRRALLNDSAAAIILTDPQLRVKLCNDEACRLFGHDANGCRSFALHDLTADPESRDWLDRHWTMLNEHGSVRFRMLLHDKNGLERWFDIHAVARSSAEPHGDFVWTLFDITAEHLATEAMHAERLRMQYLLKHFPGGVLIEDAEGEILMANDTLRHMLGTQEADHSDGKLTHDRLLQIASPEFLACLRSMNKTGDEVRRVRDVSLPNGQILEITRARIQRDERRVGQVWLLVDVTERQLRERELLKQANHDPLTSLTNRRSFGAQLQQAILDSKLLPARDGALLMLDIDHFKRVNDTWGHPVGDEVISAIADTLRSELRSQDVPARWGGEEFIVLLRRCRSDEAFKLAERLRQAVAGNRIKTRVGELHVTVSVGVASLDGSEAETVISRADQALYRAKQTGRNRVCAWPLSDIVEAG